MSDLGDTPLNGLAYCVGSIDLKPLKLTKKSDFMQSFNLNLISATEIIKSTSDNLKQNKGSIVLFSTVAVKRGFANHAIVASAKGAVEGLTVSLAAEFAPNIRVNCIAPSLTKSKISNFLLKNQKIAEGIAKMHPLKRLGEGSDSSAVAHFLLGENSSWITGQIFGVDGGRSSLT
jgi:NAD(P)-dependent dehydrogenase (short-subunit alcohol dehydrogenase family)